MKKLLLILSIFFCLQSEGQTPMQWLIKKNCSLLLDQYPGADVAFSLRKLDCDYAGSAIRVRRSSDNTEQDVGFVNNSLDTASLKTFVGTGGTDDGFIVTWYDQSGNANNATQSTTGNQPKIMDNGVIYRQGGTPSILYDGTSDYVQVSSVTLNTYTSLYLVVNSPAFFIEHSADANSNDGFFFYGSFNSSWLFRRTSLHYAQGTANWANNVYIIADLQYNGTGAYYKNGTVQNNNTVTGSALSNTSASAVLNIMARPTGSLYFSGYLSELVLYDSDKTADAANIRSNINTYYAIY